MDELNEATKHDTTIEHSKLAIKYLEMAAKEWETAAQKSTNKSKYAEYTARALEAKARMEYIMSR